MNAQVESYEFPDSYFDMNLQISEYDLPIGLNTFNHLPMDKDSPYVVSWWYRIPSPGVVTRARASGCTLRGSTVVPRHYQEKAPSPTTDQRS